MHDDVLQETPEVTEAIRRLPQDLQDARIFRIVRAMQLSCQKTILPKEQWTKYEEVRLLFINYSLFNHKTIYLITHSGLNMKLMSVNATDIRQIYNYQ